MAKFLAWLFILSASTLNSLGNFYFTYGIWPRSWNSFLLFWFTSVLIYGLMTRLQQEEK